MPAEFFEYENRMFVCECVCASATFKSLCDLWANDFQIMQPQKERKKKKIVFAQRIIGNLVKIYWNISIRLKERETRDSMVIVSE